MRPIVVALCLAVGLCAATSTYYDNLLPGDLIGFKDVDGNFVHMIIPGNVSHSGIYMGKAVANTVKDRLTGLYIPAGTPYMLHTARSKTTRSDESTVDGLGYSPLTIDAYQRHIMMRVSANWKTGAQLTTTQRNAIVARAKQYCANSGCYPAGPVYDLNWLSKDSTVGTSLYCSEHAWATYKTALGIDLDSNTPIAGFEDLAPGVSPTDIANSPYTSIISANLTMNGGIAFPATNPLYKINVRVNYAKYYKDHEITGKGEMVMRVRAGDYEHSTGASFPVSHGSYADYSDGTYVSASSGDTIYWYSNYNAQLSALVSSTRPIYISVQGIEVDVQFDDPYVTVSRTLQPGSYTLGTWYTITSTTSEIKYSYSYMISAM